MRLVQVKARRPSLLVALLILAGAAGCGSGRHPVSGRVVYEDGSPVEEGSVVGETGEGKAKVMAQGNIQPDGSFQWGTAKPGDGAAPGKYRVVVLPRALGDAETAQGMQPAVDAKYTKYDTSGITIDVKEGKNELPITVTKPKGKKP